MKLVEKKFSVHHFNIKTKMFDFEILIGWLANTLNKPGNKNTHLYVKHFQLYVKAFRVQVYLQNFNMHMQTAKTT